MEVNFISCIHKIVNIINYQLLILLVCFHEFFRLINVLNLFTGTTYSIGQNKGLFQTTQTPPGYGPIALG